MATKKKATTKKVNQTILEKEPSKTTTKSKTTSSSLKKSPSKEDNINVKTKKDVVKTSSESKTVNKTKSTKISSSNKNANTKKDNKKVSSKTKTPTKTKSIPNKDTSTKNSTSKVVIKDKEIAKEKSETKTTIKKGTIAKSSIKKNNEDVKLEPSIKKIEVNIKRTLKKIADVSKNLGVKTKENIKKANSKLTLTVLKPKIKVVFKKISIRTKKIGVKVFNKIISLNNNLKLKNKERKIKNSEKKLIKLNKKSIKKANKEIRKQTKENIILNDNKINNDLEESNEIRKFKRKKRRKRRLISLAILCIILAVLLMIPYGMSTYTSEASGITIEVPKYVQLKEECCNFSATFNTFRSVWSLEKDLEKMISKYEILNCDNKKYYYNEENNYTITDYGIKKGIIFNEVYITYGKGNSCDIDTTFKKLELLDDDFSLNDAKKDGNYVIDGDNVYNASAYDNFMKNVEDKIPSVLRIVTTNKDKDVLITDLEYLSNGKFMVTYDGTRDRNAKDHRSIIAYKYEHLGITNNMLYAYNGNKIVTKNPKKEQAYYLFTLPKT